MTLAERITHQADAARRAGKIPVALGYGRKSVVQGVADLISPVVQERACAKVASDFGLEFLWFVDAKLKHQSGQTEKHRPDWARLRALVQHPDDLTLPDGRPARILAVISERRAMFRQVRLLRTFVETELLARGIEWVDPYNPFLDISTADGLQTVTILATTDEGEARRASERTRGHIRVRKDLGLYWGMPPFGLISTGHGQQHRLIASPRGLWRAKGASGLEKRPDLIVSGSRDEFPFIPGTAVQFVPDLDAVVELYTRYAAGELAGPSLANHLNQLGYLFRTANGARRPFQESDVRRLIGQWPVFAGLVARGKAVQKLDVIGRAQFEPLLDPDLLRRVSRRQERRRSRRANAGAVKRGESILRGLLVCDRCGSKLVVSAQRSGRRYYRHRTLTCGRRWNVRQEIVEALVFDYLERALDLPLAVRKDLLKIGRSASDPGRSSPLKKVARQASPQRIAAEERRWKKLGLSDANIRTMRQILEAELREPEAPPEELLPPTQTSLSEGELLRRLSDATLLRRKAASHPELVREALSGFFKEIRVRWAEGSVKLVKVVPQYWCAPFFRKVPLPAAQKALTRPAYGSGVRNVTWSKQARRWLASFTVRGERYYVGYFKDRDEAAAAVARRRAELEAEPPERG